MRGAPEKNRCVANVNRWLFGQLIGLSQVAIQVLSNPALRSLLDAWQLAVADRELASITNLLPPVGITVRLTTNGSVSQASSPGTLANVLAGRTVNEVDLILNSTDVFNVTQPRLRFVFGSVTSSGAAAGACLQPAATLGLSHVNQPFGNITGASAQLIENNFTLSANLGLNGLVFRMGGNFRLCYSDDGSFTAGHADVPNIDIDVAGVFDSCREPACLAKKRYNCYARPHAHSASGSCALRFGGTDSGIHGAKGKVSWSALWSAGWDSSTGSLSSLTQQSCGTTPDQVIFCPEDNVYPYCEGNDTNIEITTLSGADAAILPPTRNRISAEQGFTLAACYCPGNGGCEHNSDFSQQVGIIYIFVAQLCDPGQTCGAVPAYVGATAARRFSIRIVCPPDGCSSTNSSRIKLIDAGATNDLPSWDPLHGCKSQNQTVRQYFPVNCRSATDCELIGGSRQDTKDFAPGDGFRLAATGTFYQARNFHQLSDIDVCFCGDVCNATSSWFKVGQVSHIPYRLFNLDAHTSNQIRVVNIAGSFALHYPSTTGNLVGLSTASSLKLLPDPSRQVNDAECGTATFDSSFVLGYTYSNSLSAFSGRLDGTALLFDGGSQLNTLTVTQAGIVAICYCSVNSCAEHSSDWVLAARYVIQGPMQSQRWTFSTGVNVKIVYAGHGLSSNNTLRLVPTSSTCTGNPDAATGIFLDCASRCSEVANTGNAQRNIATHVWNQAGVRCDHSNNNCETVFINSVTVASTTSTMIEFSGDPELTTGDTLVIGHGVACSNNCTAEQLASITGKHAFANVGFYDIGVPVTATSESTRYTVPFGWTGRVPQFSVTGGQGHWVRTSKATTAEEIRASQAQELKVCWGHGGDGTFVEQVGTVTFSDAPAMNAKVSLTSWAAGVTAPIIVSFTTGQSRPEYASVVNSMQLTILFTDVSILQPRQIDARIIQASGSSQQTVADASQTICGAVFKELWCGDQAAGFPLPRGCFIQITGTEARLHILFEEKDGLQPGTSYQVVLNAVGTTAATTATKIVHIMPIQDANLNPYQTIEIGKASVDRQFLVPAAGTDPQFATDAGLSLLGSENGLQELKDELDLRFRLNGDAVGKITRESILRLFMWPLTQWDMTYTPPGSSSCTATCEPRPNSNCGPVSLCVVEAVVPNAQKNIIRIMLPENLDPIFGISSQIFRVRSVSLPRHGFFAGRISGQISKRDETGPNYVESAGDLIWKQPDTGSFVSELIVKDGVGNLHPFKGDVGNTLYAHIVLGSSLTISSLDSTAAMSVRLPQGYSCSQVTAVPATLSVFSQYPKLSRGTLNSASWVCNLNICTYHAVLHELIPAGSHIFAGFTVNNPSTPLVASAVENRWHLVLKSKGFSSTMQALASSSFQAVSGPDFGSSVPVVGKLGYSYLQPTDFAISSSSGGNPVVQMVEIFFQTEQSPGFAGFIRLDAPPLFDFGLACTCKDIQASQYNTAPGAQLFALPGIVSCTGVQTADPTGSPPFNHAKIHLSGLLQANRPYAFRVQVHNPTIYNVAQQAGWRLWTQSSDESVVDGSPGTLQFIPLRDEDASLVSQQSWGMYNATMDIQTVSAYVDVQLSSLRPYILTGQEADIIVFPLRTARDLLSTLRVTAPQGYEWQFSDSDFIFRSAMATNPAVKTLTGTTADLPGGLPRRYANILTWPTPNTYSALSTYGFMTKIRVPSSMPTRSSNAFFFEFGYMDRTVSANERSLAVRIPAGNIQSLHEASVEYSTAVRSHTNLFRFTLRTVTTIPTLGGLLIQGPPGFTFPTTCRPKPVAASSYSALPVDVSCTVMVGKAREPLLQLIAGSSTIPPMKYQFELSGVNPREAVEVLNSASSPCGTTHCWTFYSLQVLEYPVTSMELDLRTSIPAISIKEQMPFAGLVPLYSAARTASGRDDRPLHANRLTFGFRLSSDLQEVSTFVLTGPTGVTFSSNCLENPGVATQLAQIFGEAITVPGYNSWDNGVAVLTCVGDGPTAFIEAMAGLKRQKTYIFNIRIPSNPQVTPVYNKWTLEVPREASLPFDGFTLWTFTESFLQPLSPVVMPISSPATRIPNLVNMTFCPFSDAAGALVVTAPTSFAFVTDDDKCPWHLEVRNLVQGAASVPQTVSPSGITCAYTGGPNMLSLVLQPPTSLSAGRLYTLVLSVYNPGVVSAPLSWQLQSYHDPQMTTLLDVGHFSGFAIINSSLNWSYSDGAASGTLFRNGGRPLTDLVFTMSFPHELRRHDYLFIVAPPGYSLQHPVRQLGEGACNNARFTIVNWSTPILKSQARCTDNEAMLHLLENATIPPATLIQLRINTVNPEHPLRKSINRWQIRHTDSSGLLQSTAMFQGWQVVPQLQQVKVALFGRTISASSRSIIDFTFHSKTAANSLRVVALNPAGFRFDLCTLPIGGQVLIEAVNNMLRVRLSIPASQLSTVRVENVELAPVGGPTTFDLATFDSSDQLADQKTNLRGFNLPGKIDVISSTLQSDYSLTPGLFPVQSLWAVRTQSVATATLTFTLTNEVRRGEIFKVSGAPYSFMRQDLRLIHLQSNRPILMSTVIVSGGELRCTLEGSLQTRQSYQLALRTTTPMLRVTTTQWELQTSDGASALPTTHTLVNLQNFVLVTNLGFRVRAVRAPPLAEAEITLSMSLGSARPNILAVIAPPGFNFSQSCLISHAASITSCEPGPFVGGRSSAVLAYQSSSGNATLQEVKLRISTPQHTPAMRAWYLEATIAGTGEQVGWGEDNNGFTIQQMRDVTIVYPAIPRITAQLAISFSTTENLDSGGIIQVLKPSEFEVQCTGENIWPVSLPGVLECQQVDTSSLRLTINGTLAQGEYAFVLNVKTPSITPLQNQFSVLLRNQNNHVRDAAMSIPGTQIQTQLAIVPLQLSWTSSEAGQASSITIGFRVIEQVPPNLIHGVLVTFPENFVHAIAGTNGITSLKDSLPVDGSAAQYDTTLINKLRISVDASQVISPGDYQFQFPIAVPEQMPAYNIWRLTLCNATCSQATGPHAFVTFPLAGFQIGQLLPGAGQGGVPNFGNKIAKPLLLLQMLVLLL